MQLAKQAYEQNLILHNLTIFHDDDVIYTKIMTILSTSTSGISNVFYRNLWKKETAVILKRIDQLPQILARVYNFVGSFDRSHQNLKFLILPIVSIVFCCLSIVSLLFQLRYSIRGTRCSLM